MPDLTAAPEVEGCVDSLRLDRQIGGWASETGRSDPMRIEVRFREAIVGTGIAGLARRGRRDACGFSVHLARSVTLDDLMRGDLRAFAIDSGGQARELRIWDKLVPESIRASLAFDRATGADAAADPEAEWRGVLPPLGVASDLAGALERIGRGVFLPDLTVDAVLESLGRDSLPIPHFLNREKYCAMSNLRYWLFGFDDYHRVRRQLARFGVRAKSVLDFGGSTGRVFRHFYAQGEFDRVHACDANPVNVAWCARYLPSAIDVRANSFDPLLPFPDDHFDLITAFSVFTHIDAGEELWLAELRRTLKPGGMAYLSVHDESAWTGLPENLLRTLRASPEAAAIDFRAPMPAERLVFRSGPSQNVFHSDGYIRRVWGRILEIEDIMGREHGFHSVVVARRPSN